MLRDFLRAEPEKASGVVVEDVTPLLRAQERRIFDGLDGYLDGARPHHLVGPPHNPFLEDRVNEPPELPVKMRSRNPPVIPGDVHVHLRMREEQRNHLVNQWRAVMHHVEAKLGMSNQHLFKLQGAGEPGAV